jgi:hypothetical protein
MTPAFNQARICLRKVGKVFNAAVDRLVMQLEIRVEIAP